MKLCVWRDHANFGDELNFWLWPKLLPDFFDGDERRLFIGMGSILHDNYPANAEKIVFGSGYAGYSKPPRIDENWAVYFVRGPQTAECLGLNSRLGVGDPASLVGTIAEAQALPRATRGPAFMPHWESARDGAWKRICELAEMRYIDPRWPVETVLVEIAASSILVTEAMHGAIVADSLRIPWVPISPNGRHHPKWYDWANSLGLNLKFSPTAPSVLYEAVLPLFSQDAATQSRVIRYGLKVNLPMLNRLFERGAVAALKRASVAVPHMSSSAALARALETMRENLAQLRIDYPRTSLVPPTDFVSAVCFRS